MDSVSITDQCVALDQRVGGVLLTLGKFVRQVREARSDADTVSRELHSLQTILGLLNEDADLFPPELAEKTSSIVEHCSAIVGKLDQCLSTLSSPDLATQDKRMRWLDTGRSDARGYSSTLEVNKAAIGLALDLVGATTIRDMVSNPEHGDITMLERRQMKNETLTDIARTLIQMDQLRTRLPSESERTPSGFSLREYMSYLKLYGETILRCKEAEYAVETRVMQSRQEVERKGAYMGGDHTSSAYVGDEPDSAVDMNSEPFSSHSDRPVGSFTDEEYPPIEEERPSTDERCPPIDEEQIDEYTPSIVEEYQYDDVVKPLNLTIDIPSRAPTPPPRDLKRLDATRKKTNPSVDNEPDSPTIPYPYGFMTEITPSKSSFTPSITSTRKGRLGRFFSPFKGHIPEDRPSTVSTESTASGMNEGRPTTPAVHGSEKANRRLSMMKMPSWKPHQEHVEDVGPFSKVVFGVSLQRSMQIAKGSSRTHHGGGAGGSSRREFPLCMQKCCIFIKEQGVHAPDIFAQSGDIFRVSKLKEIFSTGPTFGSDINWDGYTVYDVAALMSLYLSQLPKPLVSESLGKKWVSLSRREAKWGSHAARLDQCIDFWEEAMSGLRGPSRSLFKLILNLWADVAAAEEDNGMEAERLAGVVLKPLMHVEASKYRTDYKLALGFLIRRRIEYLELMTENKSAMNRISRAAW
ncbi:Rho GTPase activation protein [Poronia punctata]|nr:Rho GTPase activation protein [Poronia punctata]